MSQFEKIMVEKHRGVLIHKGPVVQSIISITNSLRDHLVKCFMTLLPNTMIFLLKKKEAFAHFFQQKYWHIPDI